MRGKSITFNLPYSVSSWKACLKPKAGDNSKVFNKRNSTTFSWRQILDNKFFHKKNHQKNLLYYQRLSNKQSEPRFIKPFISRFFWFTWCIWPSTVLSLCTWKWFSTTFWNKTMFSQAYWHKNSKWPIKPFCSTSTWRTKTLKEWISVSRIWWKLYTIRIIWSWKNRLLTMILLTTWLPLMFVWGLTIVWQETIRCYLTWTFSSLNLLNKYLNVRKLVIHRYLKGFSWL